MKNILNLVLASSLALGFVACESDDDSSIATGELTLNLTGLEQLGDDYVYEGWVIVDGSPVSTGVFSSVEFPQTFNVNQDDLDAATTFVLSIEPAVDSDPAPADTKILAGDFSSNSATVSSAGIVADFSDASGKFILATPTDSDDTNEYSGVWFLDNSSGSAETGLTLPELSAGWIYEGWIVVDGTAVSTGTFLSADGADDNADDLIYTTGENGSGPGYPGEDYVTGNAGDIDFPVDLRGNTVVVSVEPVPDNSAAPFTLKPLLYGIDADAMTHSTLDMGTASGPVVGLSGTVTK